MPFLIKIPSHAPIIVLGVFILPSNLMMPSKTLCHPKKLICRLLIHCFRSHSKCNGRIRIEIQIIFITNFLPFTMIYYRLHKAKTYAANVGSFLLLKNETSIFHIPLNGILKLVFFSAWFSSVSQITHCFLSEQWSGPHLSRFTEARQTSPRVNWSCL